MMGRDAFVPLPRGGMKRQALACILEVRSDSERQMRLFSDYPSYLSMTLDDEKTYSRFLIETDFSQSKERWGVRPELLLSRICKALEYVHSREEAGHLFAMLGWKRKAFGNLDKEVVAPYHTKLDLHSVISKLRSRLLWHMVIALFDLLPSDIEEVFAEED